MFKLDLEKAEKLEIKLPTSFRALKKQESSRKTSTPALLTTPKSLTVWITILNLVALISLYMSWGYIIHPKVVPCQVLSQL